MVCHSTLATLFTSTLSPLSQFCHLEQQFPIRNPNHIFNAIHSLLRQFGSALNHNGMSMSLADIPEGARLYQGSDRPALPTTYGYLAFEVEHALWYAYAEQNSEDTPAFTESKTAQSDPRHKSNRMQAAGHLRTFTTKRSLKVLYFDGLSAAKTDCGAQDTQSYVFNTTRAHLGTEAILNGYGVLRGGGGDHARVYRLCDLVRNAWHDTIDGFIRNEFGFELVLCDFPGTVELVESITRTQLGKSASSSSSKGPAKSGNSLQMRIMNLLRGLKNAERAVREMVTVDYQSMISAFAADIDLFDSGRSTTPRLTKASNAQLRGLFDSVTAMVEKNRDSHESYEAPQAKQTVDWQNVVDNIVARYSDVLYQLAYAPLSTDDFDELLSLLIEPFVDYDSKSQDMDLHRCMYQHIPQSFYSVQPPRTRDADASHFVALRAVLQVTYRICSTLLSIAHEADGERYATSTKKTQIRKLVEWLSWTTWKECRPGCAVDEICFAALWPWGDSDSHDRPRCIGASSVSRQFLSGQYWDAFAPKFLADW